MKTLRSHVGGSWYEAKTGFTPLLDPCTEEPIAQASSEGLDFGAALHFAREEGGPALRSLTFEERGDLLLAMSKALHAVRDELIEGSLLACGTTRKDSKFDLDGATSVLAFYGYLGKELGAKRILADGEGVQLGRSARFWGQHVLLPLPGVAVHVNAFNFPAWGFAEKAACSILAGVPAITKPATSTAFVTERCIEVLVDAAILPPGALSLVVGSTGDLLAQLGSQDMLGFTGSAATALQLRRAENLLASSVRVNIEADSLNAAVLGPDVRPGSECWRLFLREVEREITQKSGQKCTAIRRIFVPADRIPEVEAELSAALSGVVTGNPRESSVTMGPLASRAQLEDGIAGIAKLEEGSKRICGTGTRADGVGNPAGKGYFLQPTLLRAADARAAQAAHEHEVFGPVATLLAYDGTAREAAELVALARGTLVVAAYSDDETWVAEYLRQGGAWTGRLYLGSEKMAEQALGSGLAMPQSMHGGPGRAGGGEELGGLRGLSPYLRRVALQGSRATCDRLAGLRGE